MYPLEISAVLHVASGGPISDWPEMGERASRGRRAPGSQEFSGLRQGRKRKRAFGDVTRGGLRGPALCGGKGKLFNTRHRRRQHNNKTPLTSVRGVSMHTVPP